MSLDSRFGEPGPEEPARRRRPSVHVEPALVDEEAIKRMYKIDRRSAADCTLALAEAKARQLAESHRDALVVGADQILACDGNWFSKPVDLAAARAQLQVLRGRTHELVTAACVVFDDARIWHSVVSAKLTMRHFSEAFLDAYLGAEQTALTRICRRLLTRGKRDPALCGYSRRLFWNSRAAVAGTSQLFAHSRLGSPRNPLSWRSTTT